jgi:N-acetylglucosaminyl-diphospho-decaprenol L-rhamnosyltransferase
VVSVLDEDPSSVRVVRPGRNVGYGGGVNRGLAALAAEPSPPEWVLVSNADLEVHRGALAALRAVLETHPAWAIVGPRVFTDAGEVYPSVRAFPSFTDAAGHALLAQFKPDNPFTRRYNPGAPEGDAVTPADWVSGSCFMARRDALEELGGFDESYFMYLEDTDLCWRAHHAGWGVGFAGTAEVTHVQGVSTARHPYRMMVAHHRSALRFTVRTNTGWRRLALPAAVLVLGVRMAMATARLAFTR